MAFRWIIGAVVSLAIAGCSDVPAQLAPDFAEPKTRPSRNFTSFDESLRCMDGLFLQAGRPRYRVSSTGILDATKKISVGGDDMLINALSRMTQRSRAYVFLDQGLVKDGGIIDLSVVQPEDPPRPSFYIRGSISQLDSDVGIDSFSGNGDRDVTVNGVNQTLEVSASNSRELSVVSVDMHLVRYPSRQVVPGASVSNSMVVRERRKDLSVSGLITMAASLGIYNDGISIEMDRIESPGQAVRNLIEVSLIELLGRHSNVAWWTCSALPDTDAQDNSDAEQSYTLQGQASRVLEIQQGLIALGLLDEDVNGSLTRTTRAAIASFQAQEDVLVTGDADFDTLRRMRKRLKALNRLSPALPVSPKPKVKSSESAQSAGYQPLGTGNFVPFGALPPADKATEENE